MIRVIFYGILFFLIYRFLKKLFEPNNNKNSQVKGKAKKEQIHPYDESKVEDIDYEDL
jgi:hypothetical protein